MIISTELQDAYELALPTLRQFKSAIDTLLAPLAGQLAGQYESARIKPPESITAKIEKDSPKVLFWEMEDIVAATIVLSSHRRIQQFEERVVDFCIIDTRKSERYDKPEEFSYDDRHLICKLRPDYHAVVENPILGQFKFEIQIKTHLQFALSKWSRGTYKTAKLSWNLARLVSQTRALVELADSALAKIEEGALAANEVIEYRKYSQQNEIIDLISARLSPSQIPEDLRRLAITVDADLKSLFGKATDPERVEELRKLLDDPKNSDLVAAESLTAYNVVFIAMYRAYKDKVLRSQGEKLVLALKSRGTLLVTREMLAFCPELHLLSPDNQVDLTFPS